MKGKKEEEERRWENRTWGGGGGDTQEGQSTLWGHRSWPRPQLQAWPVGRTWHCVQAFWQVGGQGCPGGSGTGRGVGHTTPFRPAVKGPQRLWPEHHLYDAPRKTRSGQVSGTGLPQAHGSSVVQGRPAGPAASPLVLQGKYSLKYFLFKNRRIRETTSADMGIVSAVEVVPWHHGCVCIPGSDSCCCRSSSVGDRPGL